MSEDKPRRRSKAAGGRKKKTGNDEPAPEAVAAASPAPSSERGEVEELFDYAEELQWVDAGEDEDEGLATAEPWVAFQIAERRYALPVARIQEVLRVGAVTRVPHAPKTIRGVTNMRGRVLPLVDLRERLGFPAKPVDGQDRILVTLSASGPVGLLVDAVEHMVSIRAAERSAPPEELGEAEQGAAIAVVDSGETPMVLLDLERILAPFATARAS